MRFTSLLLLCAVLGLAQPAYRSNSGLTSTATTCSVPTMPSGMAVNDVVLFVAESENEAISLGTANGYVEVTNSPQSAGTAAANPANRLAVYWKRITNAADTSPVTTDSGNHTTCNAYAFSGVITTGNPWDVTAGGDDGAANDTSAAIPGATTTVDNTLVVAITGTSFNGTSSVQCGTPTNADLTSLTERFDGTNTINLGGGHCLITGVKASAGTYADTTLTLANTSFKGAISIALQPPGGGGSTLKDPIGRGIIPAAR